MTLNGFKYAFGESVSTCQIFVVQSSDLFFDVSFSR